MTALVLSALFLVASHALLSAPGIRPSLIAALGKAAFYTVYSLISLAALTAFVWAYAAAGPGPELYPPVPGARAATALVMPLALLLMIGRVTTPYGEPAAPEAPVGIYRLARFPGSAGLLMWSVLHLGNSGQDRTVVAFATLTAISALAVIKNEIVRRRAAHPYLAETSLIPLGAIAGRRQSLTWREIGWARTALALAAYGAIIFAHPYLFAADPLAGLR